MFLIRLSLAVLLYQVVTSKLYNSVLLVLSLQQQMLFLQHVLFSVLMYKMYSELLYVMMLMDPLFVYGLLLVWSFQLSCKMIEQLNIVY